MPASTSVIISISISISISTTATATATATALTPTPTTMPATSPTESFPLNPIVVLINVVDELCRDLFGKKNRAAVIEIDTVFPGVARQDTDHRIATVQTATNLTGLLLGEGQMNVRTTHTLEAVTLNVGHISATHSGKQLVRRFVRFPGIHLNRVAI